jgi:membrane protein insertase Oxa1/YidC/SpoIIIJ
MRAIVAVFAGSLLGAILKPHADQGNTIGITILIAIIFYIISYVIAKNMAKDVTKEKRKKMTTTNGIFAYIFMLLTFMVLIFTAVNQHHM